MINKKQIPYILRVLCRWIPGLKLEESGNTPVPPHKGLRLGDEVYTIYFNTSQTPDLAGLDWTKDTYDVPFMGVATAKVKALFALDHYGAESSEVEKHSVFMAMFVPKGWVIPEGPSADTVVDIDTYFISGGIDSTDSIEEILSHGGGDMIYADPEFLKLVGGAEGFQENGWIAEAGLYELSLMLVEDVAQSKRVEVSLIPEPAKSNEIVDRLPFERTEITPETYGEVLFYDPDIVPDFNKLTCWKEVKLEDDGPSAFLAKLFGEDTDYAGSHGICALKYPKGMEIEGYVIKEDAIVLMVDGQPIYINNGYCIVMKDLEHEDLEPGWATVPEIDRILKSFNLIQWQSGGSGSFEDIVVNDFDIWGKWLSVEPFYYPEVVVPKAAPPEPGTLTKFRSGQTVNSYDKIVFDLTRSDEMRRFLENDVQYDSCGYANYILRGDNDVLLNAYDLTKINRGFSEGKVLTIGGNLSTDSVVYSTVTADSSGGDLHVREGFNNDILTDGAIEFDISVSQTVAGIFYGDKWNGILAGYQQGTEPPTPVITPGFTVGDQFNSNSAALYLNPNKANDWHDLMTNWTYEDVYDCDILRASDVNGSDKQFKLKVHSVDIVDAALYLYQYGDCQGTETLLYTPQTYWDNNQGIEIQAGFQPIVTENNGYVFLNADNIDFEISNLYYENEGWNNVDLITYMASEKPFTPTESFVVNERAEHAYLNTNMDISSVLTNLDYNNSIYEYVDCAWCSTTPLLFITAENNNDVVCDVRATRIDNSGDISYQLRYYTNRHPSHYTDGNLLYSSHNGWTENSNVLNSYMTQNLEKLGGYFITSEVYQQSMWKDFINQDSRILD